MLVPKCRTHARFFGATGGGRWGSQEGDPRTVPGGSRAGRAGAALLRAFAPQRELREGGRGSQAPVTAP